MTPARPAVLLAAALCTGPALGAPDLPMPPDHPVLRHRDPERNTTTIQVQVLADRHEIRNQNPTFYQLQYDRWEVSSMVVVLPVIGTTSSAIADPEAVSGQLWVDGVSIDTSPTLIGPYQGQSLYARYEGANLELNGFRVRQQQDMICYETVYDEPLAMRLGWPDAWPPEADSTFQPEQLVSEVRSDFENEGPVNDLVRLWTNGQDPKSIPPAQLAKYLCAKVWDHVRVTRPVISNRPSDSGIVIKYDTGRDNQLTGRSSIALDVGYVVQHADETAESGEGSPNDLAILLTAVYRAAGLPARLVIGYREETEDERRLSSSESHRAWVEFALFDPAANEGEGQLIWVPVDLVALKKSSSRSRPIDRPWKYFGTNDELDTTVPFATHFHPPTTVRSYAVPALYGWTTTPGTPESAAQGIYLNISSTPIRGGD